MQIFVKDAKTLTIDCEPTDTILFIKNIVSLKLNIPPNKQRLLYGGKQLNDDNKTIQECDIQNNGNIQLLCRFN